MEKEHFEILLEHMNSKFDLVLEGQAALAKNIDDNFESLRERIDRLILKLSF